MSTRGKGPAWVAAAVALLVLTVAAPASFARGVGGGHDGAHAGAARSGGAHFGRAHVGGARLGVAPRFGRSVGAPRFAGRMGTPGVRGSFAGRPSAGGRAPYRYGYRGYRWGGGYWHGAYWPPVFWGAYFPWYLAALPAYAPVYWWGGVPYYYYDDGYYVWDPDESGYVATAPPPADTDGSAAPPPDDGAANMSPPDSTAPDSQPPANAAPQGAPPPGSDHLYAYPKNGQSAAQQAEDRQTCDQWATSQAQANGAGADGTDLQNSLDYQRAMVACLTGRGYSVD